ncbi:P-loop NTPase family protein [Mycoplasma suis]|uniref:DnaA chromosomal replication initiation protein n=1 Tax=Mycoplasma suis (strain Illinois) TaxID=768700 RepID=F0QPY2_MYCSL|nr:chromosomal replication protein DnaA [Mycoplasma suis]ADX97552.1 dnaA chromosomal replication initiation protein [Mycoplasma suis str. Illinois]
MSKNLLEEIKKHLNNDLNKFKTFSETDFYIENSENSSIRGKIEELLSSNSGNSILILGEKGCGKTHLFKWFLKDLNDFLYIDFLNFRKISLFLTEKNLEKFDFLFQKKLLLIDNFEDLKINSKLYKKVKLLKEEREKRGNINIFIETWEKNLFEYKNALFEKKDIIYLRKPNNEFLKEMIKNLIQKNFKELKITESSISFLSIYLGNDLKIFINKLLKLFLFLKCFEYNANVLDTKNLQKILDFLFNEQERKELINYRNNSQLEIICEKKNFEVDRIRSKSKKRKIVFERDQVIFILKEKLNFSIKDISKILLKSQSGINYSLKKTYRRRKSENFREYFDFLAQI